MSVTEAADDNSLRILINSKLREPYYFYDSDSLRQHTLPTRGIMIDIQAEIARKIGRRPVWKQLPRSQVEDGILTGQADVQCFVDKRWTERPQDYFWTETVLQSAEWMVSKKRNNDVLTLEKLRNKRIGTIVQYRYPEVEAAFGEQWKRDDADSDLVNLTKLLNDRVDAIVITELSLRYWRRNKPEFARVEWQHLLLNTHELRCLIAPSNAELQIAINEALQTLKSTHRIQAIINAYAR